MLLQWRRNRKEFRKSLLLVSKSTENGNEIAMYYLARCYKNGKGTEKNLEKSFYWYQIAAENGVKKAMNNLAICCYNGEGTEKNLEKAFYWYQKAAEKDYVNAMINLARCYYNGEGTEKDLEKAFHWFQKAAENGDEGAMNSLASNYYNGEGTEKDLEKAFHWFQKAAENGVKEAMFNLANRYYNGEGTEKNLEKAFYWYQKAAEKDYINAMINLAICYRNGEGTEKNLEKAFHWCQKAAENGDEGAMNSLAMHYENGEETEKDFEKAFYWHQKAAEHGDEEAMFYLAICYKNGEGTEKDLEKSFYWYQKAAEKDYINAMIDLAICYYNGEGTEKNLEKAFHWYQKAAEHGDEEAMFNLASNYYNGEGTEMNLEKSFHWFQKAAENGGKEAMFNLANRYYNGEGTEKDLEKAFYWYQEAVEDNHFKAMNSLAICYENGEGTEKNLEKAFYWYQKAAENGIKLSQYNSGLCYENGNGVKKDEVKAYELYKKSAEQLFSDDALNKLSQRFISKINIPTVRTTINSINNKQQIIQQLRLNHGLLLDEYSIQPSKQAVFMEDGELDLNLCNRQPIIYDLSIDKDNYKNILQTSDICINFPIAEITYKGDVSKSFSKCVDNDAILNKLYGHFFARKVLVGSKLLIKNLKLATQTQVDILKFYLLCTYSSAKYSTEISFNNSFALNLLPKIVTLDGDELNTHEKLAKWMSSLYQEGEKSIFILSYENLIPISQLKKFITEKQPGVIDLKEKLSLVEWVGDVVDNNLASWTRKFHLFQGLIFNNYEMEISKKPSIDFIKIPKVNTSNKSYLKIIKPSTKLEVCLISNDILSLKNLSSFLFTKRNDTMSYEEYYHILIKCEQYEILLSKDNVRPTKEFEHVIEEALNSMMPLKALQNIFNEYGHLFPQRIILGRSLKNILPTLSSSAFETIVSGSESFKLHLDKLNISHFLTPKGKIIKKNDLLNWIQNPNNLEAIEFDDIILIYKILKEKQQKKIDDILQSNYRILMTGVTDLRDLDNNDVDYYKRINIEPSLEDENYKVFGSIISKDNSILEEIYVNFGLYDVNGFFASIKKLEETSVNIKECCILWMIVEKPSELLIFSPSNREFQVERVKESIILQLDKLNYCIKTSFPLSQGYTIFVHAYYPSNNHEPDNTIKLVKWSYNYVTFQIIKSTYGKSNNTNNNFSEDIRKAIKLDLHICFLCSEYRSLKIDNKDLLYSFFHNGAVSRKI
ncbi:HCP-like protein [Rhizophagus irregularis]|uniref:HCP-like protein n=1 Tax=Rhizophagus irregularis TaxID=588596 RepID=A0A2N1NZ30_9GLOM|nr:HCP-like protein [Rhizophagus irregularis]